MTWTRKALAMILAVTGLALAGCKGQDANTIRFRFWGDTEEVRIIEAMVKEFEAANPGIKVRPERKEASAVYADVLLQEFAADRAPDVIFASTDNMELLVSSGKLADLTPYLAAEPDLKIDDYYASMVDAFSRDGKLLALPRDIAPVAVIYYNKSKFDEAKLPYPKDNWTWDDLAAAATKLTLREKDGSVKQWGFADDWAILESWVYTSGGKFLDDYKKPTRATIASPEAMEGVLFRWKLIQKNKCMPSTSDSQALANTGGPGAMFMTGKLAMLHSGIWKTPAFRKIDGFKWDVAPFPVKKGAKNSAQFGGGSGYTMRTNVKNPEACWKLIKFLAGPEGQKRMAATGLAQPSLKAMANSEIFLDGKDPQNKKMLLAMGEKLIATPAWTGWQEFLRGIWGPTTDPMWVGGFEGDPAALIKKAEDKANEKFFSKK